MSRIRTYRGYYFDLKSTHSKKPVANNRAKDWRAKGKMARVEPLTKNSRRVWGVYVSRTQRAKRANVGAKPRRR